METTAIFVIQDRNQLLIILLILIIMLGIFTFYGYNKGQEMLSKSMQRSNGNGSNIF